ncbi:leukocyte immunoglobulin-like receptor subfamily A member 3 [Eptesicus fuscus]|uniref:leukocyte immunoglobulin-like receptor subfamily A member 3 n=1 Tax=Eptesicus fuscus TaxID=29078 RepID=UPI0024047EF7|nr:leukocyte immunoglobulin-like receptor subfamily A member 3 [Eptesicus fuscus]
MEPDQTGLYRCSYRIAGHYSQLSNILRVVMTGYYNNPSLSSMSGTVVAPGDNVKLQCFSRIKFEAFILRKEDAPRFTQRQSSIAQDNGQQTTFHLDRVTSTQAGTYRCYGAFSKDPFVWSHPSDPLQLVIRGSYDKPSLSSMSGTVVAPGDNVKLQCFSNTTFHAFILSKEDAPQFTQRQSATAQDNGQQTTFHLDRVTSTQAGTYRCYGAFSKDPYVWSHPSDPLQLEVRGIFKKPSLSSMSGTVVAPGDNVKLQCFSRIKFEAFILTKENAPQFTQRQSSTAQDNGVQTTFHLDRVTATRAGTYRCYGVFSKDPYVWSHPSDPLQLEVRGFI